jgi:hypothetical protein
MNAIRTLTLASAAAMALSASGSASAASYLFTFQFDALTSNVGNFAATTAVFSADEINPTALTYVSGDINGATPAGLFRAGDSPQRVYVFGASDFGVPVGAIADIFFSLIPAPVGLGTFETTSAGRGIRTSGGATYRYTTGRLTITEVAAAVPEPGTWAMLIVGFLAVGGALRRRGTVRSVRVAYS